MKLTTLKRTLRQYANDDLPEGTVLEKLSDAPPIEMWQAKLSLMNEEDMTKSQLKSIAEVINRLTQGYTNKLKDLPTSHPLKIFVLEHRQISKILKELEKLEINEFEDMAPEVEEKLRRITEKLLEIEKHEMREEKNLLPKIEALAGDKKAISGMTNLINIRHSQLTRKIVRLRDLSREGNKKREKIIESRDKLIYSMRDHTFKESRILYPLALDLIEDWSQIKKENEDIGYIDLEIED